MEKAAKQAWMAAAGVAIGGWRRGLVGAVLGGGMGFLAGSLLSSRQGSRADAEEAGGMTAEPEGHYLRYPEEGVVDAFNAAEGTTAEGTAAEGAELEDLYREVAGPGGPERMRQ